MSGFDVCEAPWTEDEVASLTAYQESSYLHPFTGEDGSVLVATADGWIGMDPPDIVQTWAFRFMTDWSWKNASPVSLAEKLRT